MGILAGSLRVSWPGRCACAGRVVARELAGSSMVRSVLRGPLVVFAAGALLLSLSVGAANNPIHQRVEAHARACFAQLTSQHFAEALSCVERDSLASAYSRYVGYRVRPNYKKIPTELKLAFGTGISRSELLALPPIELLAGALAGTVRTFELGGSKMRNIHFEVVGVKHRIEEVYEVWVKASAEIRSRRSTQRIGREYAVLAHHVNGTTKFLVPDLILELIGPARR